MEIQNNSRFSNFEINNKVRDIPNLSKVEAYNSGNGLKVVCFDNDGKHSVHIFNRLEILADFQQDMIKGFRTQEFNRAYLLDIYFHCQRQLTQLENSGYKDCNCHYIDYYSVLANVIDKRLKLGK